ncbi:MAG: AAA family ATPase [Chlorobiales bacterium]|nr:AAA family ATPase [Chlorobiales bacterium]
MGEHIILSAPRRVGKTSIMKDLEKNCPEGVIAIYRDIESDKTQKELFKRLLTLLIERLESQKRFLKQIELWWESRRIGGVSVEGKATSLSGKLQFETVDRDYKEDLLSLIEEFAKEDILIVFLLDEFPDVIRSIQRNEGKEIAIETLHTLRAIVHNGNLNNKVKFIFAGSIGIKHVVASLDRPKLINQFHPFLIDPLSHDESHSLMTQLLDGATMQICDAEKDYLLQKINHLLPYYIQLMIEKCDAILHKDNRRALTNDDIDAAFQLVIREGRNFDDWESRLKSYLDAADAKYCIGILTRSAHQEPYSIQEAYGYSKKDVPASPYKQLLDDVLLKDGYLVEEQGRYRFLSPFLREWWKNRHPEFEIEN